MCVFLFTKCFDGVFSLNLSPKKMSDHSRFRWGGQFHKVMQPHTHTHTRALINQEMRRVSGGKTREEKMTRLMHFGGKTLEHFARFQCGGWMWNSEQNTRKVQKKDQTCG